MKRKPLKLDWEELESAFQSKREDLLYYLDLVTGQVILEGEGEDTLENDDDLEDDLENGAHRKETTRLYIDPPDLDQEISWMEDFVDGWQGADGPIAKLRTALDEDDPVEAFREVLRHFPEDRERWFLYRSGCIHGLIEAWLTANEVRSTEPPPWK